MNVSQFETAFTSFCLRGPDERQSLGSTDAIGTFSSINKTATQRDLKVARGLLSTLAEVAVDPKCTANFEVNRVLYKLYLERFILEHTVTYNGRTNVAQMPVAADRIGESVFGLLINDPRPEVDRVADLIDRIQSIPQFLAEAQSRLTHPVARWAKIETSAIEGLPDLLDTALTFVTTHDRDQSQSLKSAIEQANQAFEVYIAHVEQLPMSTNFTIGMESAQAVMRSRGIMIEPSELKVIASDFLARTRCEIESLRVTLSHRYKQPVDISAEALQKHLIEQYAVQTEGPLENVLDRYRAEEDKVLAFIEATKLFPIPKDQRIEILRTPSFLEPTIPAGAMLAPAALSVGTKKSLVYLTLSQELLAEHNELSIPVMMVHEGIPGHHLQLTWAASHPQFIRRVYDSMDLAEGWTTMLEDYMLDQGYAGDLTDEVRFMAKREICRLAARVGIDLFFMTGDQHFLELDGFKVPEATDPFVRAGALLQSVTGFVDGRVQAELNWYSKERGYPLSYLTGNHLMWALKVDYIAKHGAGRTTDRSFHEAVLRSGNMPLHLLRKMFTQEGLIDP
jgi:hypothetical protein